MANRVMVIGLDGATLDIILPWVESNYLPNIKKLILNGSFGKLESVLPVISSCAWASFMTGVNPGKHGMIDFVKRNSENYELRAVNRHDIKRKSLWKILSEQGKKSIIINVPITYPPEEINGIIVSGLGTPSNKPFTYPTNLSSDLNKKGYKVNKEYYYNPGNEEQLINEINETTLKLAQISFELARKDWDLFVVIFRDTDEMGHFFWKFMDSSHPLNSKTQTNKYKNAILDYYKLIDVEIGKFISLMDEETTLLIMSDHGQGPLYKDVYLNEWLRKKGYLFFKEHKENIIIRTTTKLGITRENVSKVLRKYHLSKVETLIKDILKSKITLLPKNNRPDFEHYIDWEKTKAYSFGYNGQIYINLKGREPNGIVSNEDYHTLVNKIKKELYEILDYEDNIPIVDKVILRDEYFSGENLQISPDICIIMRDFSYITRQGYEILEEGKLFGLPTNFESASHRLNGLLIMSGNQVIKNQQILKANIMDCTPTILYLLDCEIPTDLDGKVIRSVLSTSRNEIYYNSEEINTNDTEKFLTQEENDELIDRLKNLGYLK